MQLLRKKIVAKVKKQKILASQDQEIKVITNRVFSLSGYKNHNFKVGSFKQKIQKSLSLFPASIFQLNLLRLTVYFQHQTSKKVFAKSQGFQRHVNSGITHSTS